MCECPFKLTFVSNAHFEDFCWCLYFLIMIWKTRHFSFGQRTTETQDKSLERVTNKYSNLRRSLLKNNLIILPSAANIHSRVERCLWYRWYFEEHLHARMPQLWVFAVLSDSSPPSAYRVHRVLQLRDETKVYDKAAGAAADDDHQLFILAAQCPCRHGSAHIGLSFMAVFSSNSPYSSVKPCERYLRELKSKEIHTKENIKTKTTKRITRIFMWNKLIARQNKKNIKIKNIKNVVPVYRLRNQSVCGAVIESSWWQVNKWMVLQV